jgi:hypothetical protein
MAKIRTEISIESSESLTIRRKRYSVRTFCEECRRISIMVLPTEAAFLACQDIDSIVSLMYEDKLHIRYIEQKGMYICLTSLCLYKFENEYEDLGIDNDSIKVLTDVQTDNYKFVSEE